MDNQPSQFVDENMQPITRTSVVAFLDVLGFTNALKSSFESGTYLDLLREYRSALDDALGWVAYNFDLHGNRVRESWKIKTFSDCIALGVPLSSELGDTINGEGEPEIGYLLQELAFFQLNLACHGYFVRGGLAVGQYYMDQDLIFGDGLLIAHDAEVNVARDPRIVLTDSLIEYLRRHIGYYNPPERSRQFWYVLQDSDQQYFVNYLQAACLPSGAFDEGQFETHRRVVDAKLKEFIGKPQIWSKYYWVANYHNYVCDEHPELQPYKIEPLRYSR